MKSWTVALLLVLAAARAHGEGAPPDPDTEIARRHFDRGTELYSHGAYLEAAGEFETARRFRAAPELDYNIARCYDRMERFREALQAYERYLAAGADTNGEVRARVATLKARLAPPPPVEKPPAVEKPAAVTPPTPALDFRAQPPSPARRSYLLAPILVGGVAVAALAAGIGLVASVKPDYDAVKRSCPMVCPESRWSDLRTRADVGYAMWAVAGVAAAADLYLWIYRARRMRADRAAGFAFRGLLLSGTF